MSPRVEIVKVPPSIAHGASEVIEALVAARGAAAAKEVVNVRPVLVIAVGACRHALVVHIVVGLRGWWVWAKVFASCALRCCKAKHALRRAKLAHVTGIGVFSRWTGRNAQIIVKYVAYVAYSAIYSNN